MSFLKPRLISFWAVVASAITRIGFYVNKAFYKSNALSSKKLLHFLSSQPDLSKTSLEKSNEARQVAKLLQTELFEKIGPKDLSLMMYGMLYFNKTGVTPLVSHESFIRAYIKTNGMAQEIFHHCLFEKPKDNTNALESKSNRIKAMSSSNLEKCLDELRRNGYCTLKGYVSPQLITDIVTDARRMRFSGEVSSNPFLVDPSFPPKCNTVHALPEDVYASSHIDEILQSSLLTDIAAAYLKSDVRTLNHCLWYTFAADSPTSEAAQFFHFDLDTLRWLKIFVYLSDVNENTGPHEYIEGSHIPGSKPYQLLGRGYTRLKDSDVDNFYRSKRRVAIGSPGTILLADTRCFHKGNNPKHGYRLMLQGNYAPSSLSYYHN